MKTIRAAWLRRAGAAMSAAVFMGSLSLPSLRGDSELQNPVNPNAPTPNAGVAPGHRAAGNFTARRPGNLPKYGPVPHSYTGVSKDTP
jgi:hypothetical protein